MFTFSIGRGPWRRTVICFKKQLLDPTKYTLGGATSKELRQRSETKSWRSDTKREEHLHSVVSCSWNSQKREPTLATKMGVEKSICNESTTTTTSSSSLRCTKSAFVNIYRPPALRCQSYESKDSTNFTKIRKNSGSTAITTTTTTIPVIQSISCNNSPTHLNDTQKLNTLTPQTTADASADVVSLSIEQNSQQQQQHLTMVTAAVNRRERRPDRAVYIPRARRSQTTPPATTQSQSLTSMPTENNIASGKQQQLNTVNASSSVAMVSPSKADESRKKSALKKTKQLNGTKIERKERTKKPTPKHTTSLERQVETNVVAEELLSANKIKDRNDLDFGNNCENNVNEGDIAISKVNCSITVIEPLTEVEGKSKDFSIPEKEKTIDSHADERTFDYSSFHIEDIISTDRKIGKCDIEQQELQKASMEINRSNRRIIKQTFISDILEIPEAINNIECVEKTSVLPSIIRTNIDTSITTDEEEGEEEDDWESMYNESGDCLDPKLLQELTASVGKVKIELPKMNYSAYLTNQSILNGEEFPHVLEVSNFPVEFKNQDLLMLFSQYKGSGFDIKWVDDTHALAIFSSSQIAAEVLTMGHPFVVLKPLAEATIESRLKAKKCSASLQPYRPRPETCAALARRLVTGALGVKLKTAAAERENEKRVLREAKERKLLAAKQRDEIWES